MRIIISSDGKDIESNIDQRFGRCNYFVIVDVENSKIINVESVKNIGADQGHGAGLKAAEQVGELKADYIITGELGPNSTTVLEKLKISSFFASGKINEAVKNFIANNLKKINSVSEKHSEISNTVSLEKTEGERIFFPLLDNLGLDSTISDHFGHAPFFGVYSMNSKNLKIIENVLDHADPTKSPIDQIEEAVHPTTIFAKGIGGRAIQIIAQKGLKLKTGNYATVKDALMHFDELDDQKESCGHEHHH